MVAFARREGIKCPTLAGWMSKVEERRTPAPARKAIVFAEAQLPASVGASASGDEGLEVRLPDGTVLRGRSATDLAELIRALRT